MTQKWESIDGWVNEKGGEPQIAACLSDDLAAQIVREHNAHEGLVEKLAAYMFFSSTVDMKDWFNQHARTQKIWREKALANIDADANKEEEA